MEKLLRDGRTLYNLHVRPAERGGRGEKVNKFYMSLYPDYSGGVSESDAIQYADEIKRAVNSYDELKEENTRLLEERNELLNVLQSAILALEPLSTRTPNGWDKEHCEEIYATANAAINNITNS